MSDEATESYDQEPSYDHEASYSQEPAYDQESDYYHYAGAETEAYVDDSANAGNHGEGGYTGGTGYTGYDTAPPAPASAGAPVAPGSHMTFKMQFEACMRDLGLEVPSFHTLDDVQRLIDLLQDAQEAYGAEATIGEIVGAAGLSELAEIAAGVTTSAYLGACVGCLGTATQWSIEDAFRGYHVDVARPSGQG